MDKNRKNWLTCLGAALLLSGCTGQLALPGEEPTGAGGQVGIEEPDAGQAVERVDSAPAPDAMPLVPDALVQGQDGGAPDALAKGPDAAPGADAGLDAAKADAAKAAEAGRADSAPASDARPAQPTVCGTTDCSDPNGYGYTTCIDATCTQCPTGWLNCDGEWANGCEVYQGNNNCGYCGRTCVPGFFECVFGAHPTCERVTDGG